MAEKKKTNPDTNQNKIQEPKTAFKTIRMFHSFEEAAEYEAQERAALSHDERLEHIERLRRQVFAEHLLPDGSWPPISNTFRIMKPYTHDTGQ